MDVSGPDNQTVLEKQMKTCLDPLIKSNKSTDCQFASFFRFIGKSLPLNMSINNVSSICFQLGKLSYISLFSSTTYNCNCLGYTCTFVSETHGDSMETHCECYKNCEEYIYKNDVSFTDWPRDTVKDQVYYEFFKENEYFLNQVSKVLDVTL